LVLKITTALVNIIQLTVNP